MSVADTENVLSTPMLIVEDDGLVSWALRKAAAALKVPVQVASTGAEALAAAERQRCDLAFVDVGLPDANGLDLLPRLHELSPAMRVVVITADPTPAVREKAYERGAWHFLEKPFELGEVARLIGDAATAPGGRRDARTACCLPLRIALSEGIDGPLRPAFEGVALDVSERGLRLRTCYPLQPGQLLRARPVLDGEPLNDAVRADTDARVVWSRREPGGVVAGIAYVA